MTEKRKIQAEISLDASAFESGAKQVSAASDQMATKVVQAGEKASKSVKGIGEGAQPAADQLSRAERSMVQSIERTTAAFSAGSKSSSAYYLELAKQRGIDPNILQPYLTALDAVAPKQQAVTQAMQATLPVMKQYEMSAKATSAALRQVPAQFTDIIVSLQGGQAPLTVLLQQGGQLKDIFGGVGAAARALGSYVLGLVNPFTVAAAAVGLTAVAYNQGSKEADAYRKAILSTGGAAGVTVGQLGQMAVAISNVTGGPQGAAAEALNALAASTGIAASSFERFGIVALQVNKATGVAVADTVKQFSELAKEPLTAAVKLNETVGFLTVSVYEQIKALDEQGKTSAAAAVAQNALADALAGRSREITDNLGYIESAWNKAGSAAKGAWDFFIGIGRAETAESNLAKIEQRLTNVSDLAELARKRGQNVGGNSQELDAAKQAVANQAENVKLLQKASAAKADQVEMAKRMAEWDKRGLEFLDTKEKRTRALAEAEGQAQNLRERGLITEQQYQQRLSDIREKFKDKVGPKASDDYGRLTAEISKMQIASDQYLDTGVRLEESDKFRIESLTKIEEAYRKGNITLAQAVNLESSMYDAQQRRVEVEKALKTIKISQAEYAEQIATQNELNDAYVRDSKAREAVAQAAYKVNEAVNESNALMDLEIQMLGGTSRERAIAIAQFQNELELKRAIAAIDKTTYENGEVGREEARQEARIAAARRGSAAIRRIEINEFQKVSDSITNGLTDAFLNAVESGKNIFDSFAKELERTFRNMVLRPIVSAIVNPVAQGITGLLGFSGAASAADGASTAINGANFLGSAKSWITDFGSTFAQTMNDAGQGLYKLGFEKIGGGLMDATSQAGGFSQIAQYAQTAGDALGYLNTAVLASQGKWGAAIGSGLGTYFGGPIGSAIGGAIGGYIDSAFGGGSEYTTGTGVSGTFSKSGFSGSNFQDWRNDGSSFLGIRTSGSSSGTNYSALDSATSGGLGSAFQSVQLQTATFAKILGLSADTILNFTKSIRVSLGSDAAANKKIIEDLLVSLSNDLAKTVLDTQYIRAGEAASDTLARLATNLAAVNGVFTEIGKSSLAISQGSGNSASSLIDLFGGLSAFNSASEFYYQAFYTEAERNAKTAEKLAAAFADIGLALPDTLTGYRDLVNAQDVTTDAGRATYAALISLSGAFAKVEGAAAGVNNELLKTLRFATYADYAIANAAAGNATPPRFAGGGTHVGGLRIVGENGPELEATGPSRIFNAGQLGGALGGTAAEIKALREDSRAQARAITQLTSRMVKIFDAWDINGMPKVRTV